MNATGYGLTSGLESLDDREQEHWRERVESRNEAWDESDAEWEKRRREER